MFITITEKKLALRRYNESNTILFIYFVHYMPSKLIQNVYMILLYFEFRLVVVVLSFSVEVWDPFPYVMEDLLTLRHSYVRAWVLLRRNIYVIIFSGDGWWLKPLFLSLLTYNQVRPSELILIKFSASKMINICVAQFYCCVSCFLSLFALLLTTQVSQ